MDKCSCSNLKKLELKIDFMKQTLKNKEETMQALEGSLQFSKNRIVELTKSLNNVQNDRDIKANQILYLQKAIDIHIKTIDELEKDKIQYNGLMDDICLQRLERRGDIHQYEIQKYVYEIQSLKFDLSAMEDIYKICSEEMLKQEKVIDLLRQADLDNREEMLNLNIDNKILSSQLMKKNNNECTNCKNLLATVEDIKREIPDFTSKLKSLKDVLTHCGCGQRVNNFAIIPKTNNRVNVEEKLTNLSSKIENIQYLVSSMRNDAKNVVHKYEREIKQSNSKVCHLKNILKKKNISITKLKRNIGIKTLHLTKLKRNIEKLQDYELNLSLRSESISLQYKMKHIENLFNKSEKHNKQLQIDLEKLKNSFKVLNKENKFKTEIITWLETELAESSAKGLDVCNDTHELFCYVRKLVRDDGKRNRYAAGKNFKAESKI